MGQVTEVRGRSHTVNGSVTRPNDTTAYAIGDVICNSTSAPTIITFSRACVEQGGSGVIAHASLIDSAYQSTKLSADLFLFDTTVTMDNDNATFTPTDAELATCVGVITFDGTATSPLQIHGGDLTAGAGGNAIIEAPNLAIPFNCVAGSNSLFGVLVARNAYTPVAQESFTVRLHVVD